jgi:hypothetical protein
MPLPLHAPDQIRLGLCGNAHRGNEARCQVKAFFIAWDSENKPLVWRGKEWVKSDTEQEHRERAKLIDLDKANAQLPALRNRFGKLRIEVCPIVDWAKGERPHHVKRARD